MAEAVSDFVAWAPPPRVVTTYVWVTVSPGLPVHANASVTVRLVPDVSDRTPSVNSCEPVAPPATVHCRTICPAKTPGVAVDRQAGALLTLNVSTRGPAVGFEVA